MEKFTTGQVKTDKYNQSWKITRRNDKSVWVETDYIPIPGYGPMKKTKRFKIKTASNTEYFLPYGNYANAPVISAD